MKQSGRWTHLVKLDCRSSILFLPAPTCWFKSAKLFAIYSSRALISVSNVMALTLLLAFPFVECHVDRCSCACMHACVYVRSASVGPPAAGKQGVCEAGGAGRLLLWSYVGSVIFPIPVDRSDRRTGKQKNKIAKAFLMTGAHFQTIVMYVHLV